MTPYYADPWLTVYQGDARTVLAELPAESVHCVITSPPYFGLRDYGVSGQIGLERTVDEYVESLVAVFREVRRVMRHDATLWCNLGDSYAQSSNTGGTASIQGSAKRMGAMNGHTRPIPFGLKPKDLVGIPWRVAFALQADGWYLRSDIIEEVELYCPCGCGYVMQERIWRHSQDRDIVWKKPNPMPESVTDRPTKSHEYLFLLSKSARYYYDADAVREDAVRAGEVPGGGIKFSSDNLVPGRNGQHLAELGRRPVEPGRNLRSVWTVATQPYPGAHFATFPRKLVEPCIKAGTSERGVCPECGAPWERVTTTEFVSGGPKWAQTPKNRAALGDVSPSSVFRTGGVNRATTTGWRPTCTHAVIPVPATVLDPFAGSGTTGLVAQSLSRRAVLIDLSMDYLGQLMDRNRDIPLGLGA